MHVYMLHVWVCARVCASGRKKRENEERGGVARQAERFCLGSPSHSLSHSLSHSATAFQRHKSKPQKIIDSAVIDTEAIEKERLRQRERGSERERRLSLSFFLWV